MTQIFITHSSKNNEAAVKVRAWLKEHGWADVFLDLDPDSLAPGQRWQEELRRAGERCVAVVVLVSPDWAMSKWCLTEFLVASQLGKLIFPLLIEPTPFNELPHELVAHFQFADISTPEIEAEGFERLEAGLKRAGLDPSYFPWPPPSDPTRSPFRGLDALEEIDAAVYFGREALITKGLDTLRRMRDGAPERALAIVGMSGVGKSSFLRAGLLARLERDIANFIVVPPVQVGREAIDGSHGLIARLRNASRTYGATEADEQIASLATQRQWVAMIDALRAPIAKRLARFEPQSGKSVAPRPPTVVLAVDQAEELFDLANDQARVLAEAIAACAQPGANCLVLLTIRSSSYGLLAADPILSGISHMPFAISPLAPAQYKEVIVGPARLARPPLVLEPELVDRLVAELQSSDALPLLAFALRQIYQSFAKHNAPVSVRAYEEGLGGLDSIIRRAGQKALADPAGASSTSLVPSEVDRLISLAFVPYLVSVDALTRQPQRRAAKLSDIPSEAHPLIFRLVEARLLSLDQDSSASGSIVSVVHEAIFRQWPELENVIGHEQDALIRLDSLRRSSTEWDRNGRATEWLQHRGDRLNDALALDGRSNLTAAIDHTAKEYLAACVEQQAAVDRLEQETLQRELALLQRTRRVQTFAGGLLLAITILIVVAAYGTYKIAEAQASRASATLAQVARDWAAQGFHDRAARIAFAATQRPLPLLSIDTSSAESVLARSLTERRTTAILLGHADAVNSAVFGPDGNTVLTVAADGARIWDAKTGELVRRLQGDPKFLLAGSFSSSGRLVAAGSRDGKVHIWNGRSGASVAEFPENQGPVTALAFSPDDSTLAAGYETGAVVLWTVGTRVGHLIKRHDNTVHSIAYSPNGLLLATGSEDRKAYIANAKTGAIVSTIAEHAGNVNSVAFSSDSQRLVTASSDLSVRVWDISGKKVAEIRGPGVRANAAQFSENGQLLLTAWADKIVRVFDLPTRSEVLRLRGHTGAVNSLALGPGGSAILTASDDRTARVWTLSGDRFITNSEPILDFDRSRDGALILVGCKGGYAFLIDAKSGEKIATLGNGSSHVMNVALAPDGKYAALGTFDGSISIWNIKSSSLEVALTQGSSAPRSLRYAPNGAFVLSATADGFVRIWSPTTGVEIGHVRHSATGGATSVAISPNGEMLATTGADSVARLWSIGTAGLLKEPHLIREFAEHTSPLNEVEFSGDGRFLITASNDDTARVWDIESGSSRAVLQGHDDDVASADFSPDGRFAITASKDNTVRVWNAATGDEVTRFSDYTETLREARFLPDGETVATLGFSLGIRIRRWADRRDSILPTLHGGRLHQYVCDRYLTHGLAKLDEYERTAVSQLTSLRGTSACDEPSLGDYFNYAFRF